MTEFVSCIEVVLVSKVSSQLTDSLKITQNSCCGLSCLGIQTCELI